MRLLKTSPSNDFELVSVPNDSPPPYAILSHTWEADEITYDDIESGKANDGSAGGWDGAWRFLLTCTC